MVVEEVGGFVLFLEEDFTKIERAMATFEKHSKDKKGGSHMIKSKD